MIFQLLILALVNSIICEDNNTKELQELKSSEFIEHTLVTNHNLFPYIAAILKKSAYLSAGALIDENWVLTAADALFLVRETARIIRVRLGSINYKKGGYIVPIKYFVIHPYFDDKSPIYDLALIRLPKPQRVTPSLKPIPLQTLKKDVDATHLIVTSWHFPSMNSEESQQIKSMETIKRRRLLSVLHLHPSDFEDCVDELNVMGINETFRNNIMCLDMAAARDPCMRDIGAPVVLNGVLWGIVSSWKPSNCKNELAGPALVNLVSAPNISNWIQTTMRQSSG